MITSLLTCLLCFLTLPALAGTDPLRQAKQDYNSGNYIPALQQASRIYGRAIREGNDTLTADAGNLVGLVYLAQGQARNAMPYFREAGFINSSQAKTARLAANELNIALAFSDLKKPDSAIVYARRCLERSRSLHKKDLAAMAANHLGDFEFRLGHLKVAEAHFRSVLNDPGFQSDWENSFASAGLARLKLQSRDPRTAASLADRAYRLALKAGAKWDAAQALDLAQQAYHALDDQAKAYDRLRLFKAYSDSLSSADRGKALDQLQLREKSLVNAALKDRAQIDRLLLLLAALAALSLAVVLVMYFRRNRGLKQLNAEKDRLFSIIGHDLKSPFATLQGTLNLLSSGDLSPGELVHISGDLAEQMQAASIMLDSLLTWAGKQLQGLSARPQPLDLPLKVGKVLALLITAAERKQVSIGHQVIPLPQVQGDPDQVRIMIQNLLANAIKFTPAGGSVSITYQINPGSVGLRISDSGIGMPPKLLEAVLSSQSPASSTYGTANEKGIGLGMLLIREFADQNHIGLSAESRPGEGTTFHLRFIRTVNES